MPYEILELTEEQKVKVRDLYATTKLGDMIPLVFDESCKRDGRTTEGRSIQAYLATLNVTPTTSKLPPPSGPTELTEDQKAQVAKLAPRCRTTLELARTVMNDKELKQGSQAYRLIWQHKQELYPEAADMSDEPVDDKLYQPPATLQSLVPVVNRWVTVGKSSQRAYTWGQLKASEERCLNRLMGYVRTYSFIYTASQYEKQADRDLFMSQFIRWAHDKPDLTEIEVDQMVMAAAERVTIAQIDRDIQRISKIQEDIMRGDEVDENGKKRKLSMTDVELVNAIRTKFDASKKRLSDLMSDLEEVRSKRIDAQRTRMGSVLDILDAFSKDEDMREKLLDDAIAEKEEDKAEVERLDAVDELWAMVSGQSKEEGRA